MVLHGVSLSIGSTDPLDFHYLKELKKLARRTKAPWVSDHLSWGKLEGAHYHDLLPLPYTKETIAYVSERARIVQDYLEVPFALENLSSYVSFKGDEMPEWEFYAELVQRAGVWMLLDVNNVYVSSRNHGFAPSDYIDHLPLNRVAEIHIAGHDDRGSYCLDTHNTFVRDEVWDLYAKVRAKTGGASTLLEWDDDFIPLEDTWREALKAKAFWGELAATR